LGNRFGLSLPGFQAPRKWSRSPTLTATELYTAGVWLEPPGAALVQAWPAKVGGALCLQNTYSSDITAYRFYIWFGSTFAILLEANQGPIPTKPGPGPHTLASPPVISYCPYVYVSEKHLAGFLVFV
jgi:hypothetical protein